MFNVKKLLTALICVTFVTNTIGVSVFTASAATSDSRTFMYDDYEITYTVTNSWGNTEAVTVSITNTSNETIENWMLYFDPKGEIDSNNIWNVQTALTTSGITYFSNAGYNSAILPNASVNFSYFVTDCEGIPDTFVMCQKRDENTAYSDQVIVYSSWNDEFNGAIILENNSDNPIKDWELTFDTNFTITEITSSWAGTMTALEPYSYMLKGSYTNVIAPHTSVTLGFSGVKNGTPDIISSTLTEVVVDEETVLYGSIIDGSTLFNDLDDTDNDGLPDIVERKIGTNENNEDSDNDRMFDGYEVFTLKSDPLNQHSFAPNTSDDDYDSDEDGLSNYQEFQLGTDPLNTDSDYDDLSDGDENDSYHTDPLDKDTDDDGLNDGDEVALGLNPLLADSDNDGEADSQEKFYQSIVLNGANSDELINQISVSFDGTGYINSTTDMMSVMNIDWMCTNIVGLIGEPYDIYTSSNFDEATVTISVDVTALENTSFNDLIVLWYNETEQRFVDMEAVLDSTAHTLTFNTTHFSKYLIVDCNEWYAAWSNNYYPNSDVQLHTALTIDCSDSMNYNDIVDEEGNCNRKRAALGFINQMDNNDASSMVFFHEDALLVQPLTSNRSTLTTALDRMFSNGYTNYDDALTVAYNSLDIDHNQSSDNIIVFISDGVPTDNHGVATEFDASENQTIQTAISNNVKIYTIGLTSTADQTVLSDIASLTGGQYFYAETSEELIKYFLSISMESKYDTVTDQDEDGIPDLFEVYGMPIANGEVLFSNPQTKQSDNDGIPDNEEVIVKVVRDSSEVGDVVDYINAFEFMSDAISSDQINTYGGIYFKMNSNPSDSDTDGDLDSDNADPDPMSYQLNGYFSHMIGKLQSAAEEYLDGKYISSKNDSYYGQKAVWLTFSFLRCYNPAYNWEHSNWNNAAGELSESEYNAFKNFLNSTASYDELYDYFSNNAEIYLGNVNERIDLYHMCATLSAYSYTDFAKSFVDEEYINNLCGWSGDFQTLMNSAYDKTYNKNQYNNIYTAFYNQMGKTNDYFSKDDLYADIVSLGMNRIISNNRNLQLEDAFNSFFSYSATDAYVKTFGIVISRDDINNFTEKFTFDAIIITKKIDQYNPKYNISNQDIRDGIEAFIDYLYDNYGCEVR